MSEPISPFSPAVIALWPPSTWQSTLPVELSWLADRIGAGAIKVPAFANAAARNLVVTAPADGDLVFLEDAGDSNPGLVVYDGSAWIGIWGGSVQTPTIPGGYVAQVFAVAAPDAASTTAVHAAFAGDDASNDFPGPFTNPDVPRNLSVTFAADWDGGDVTVTGADQYGNPATEEFVAVAGTTVVGSIAFATVTAAEKSAVGADAAAASIGIGNKLGLVVTDRTEASADWFDVSQGTTYYGFASVAACGFTLDAANNTVTPAAPNDPNGTRNYQVSLNVVAVSA